MKKPSITLYHFCAAHMVSAVMEEGLTKGIFPFIKDDTYSFISQCQWLTAEPDPRKQSWATRNLIPYSRTAYRLTVRIPGSYHKKLQRAVDYVKEHPEGCRQLVNMWEGSEKWYVFWGRIPPSWIVGCKKM